MIVERLTDIRLRSCINNLHMEKALIYFLEVYPLAAINFKAVYPRMVVLGDEVRKIWRDESKKRSEEKEIWNIAYVREKKVHKRPLQTYYFFHQQKELNTSMRNSKKGSKP